MSLKMAADIQALKDEVAKLREEANQAGQRPHMLAEFAKKFDSLQAMVEALSERIPEPVEDEKPRRGRPPKA